MELAVSLQRLAGRRLELVAAHVDAFACTGTLTRVGRATCEDAVASLLDREMAANDAQWQAAAPVPKDVTADQRAWLARHGRICPETLDDTALRLCAQEHLRARSRHIEQRMAAETRR